MRGTVVIYRFVWQAQFSLLCAYDDQPGRMGVRSEFLRVGAATLHGQVLHARFEIRRPCIFPVVGKPDVILPEDKVDRLEARAALLPPEVAATGA